MLKAVVAGVFTLIVSVLAEGSIGVRWNLPGIGTIVAVILMGGCILAAIEKNKQ